MCGDVVKMCFSDNICYATLEPRCEDTEHFSWDTGHCKDALRRLALNMDQSTLAKHEKHGLTNFGPQLFWEEATAAKALLSSIPKLEESVRSFIVGVVAMTYQLVEKDELSKMLNLQGAELDKVCTDKGFKVQGSDVVIPAGVYTGARSRVFVTSGGEKKEKERERVMVKQIRDEDKGGYGCGGSLVSQDCKHMHVVAMYARILSKE